MPRPRGSGIFSAIFGALFVAALVASYAVDLRKVCPYTLFRLWLAFVAVTLLWWGINRIVRGDQSYRVGQDTINFVVGLIGASVAIFTLVVQTPSCG
jgi:hypothetical protein